MTFPLSSTNTLYGTYELSSAAVAIVKDVEFSYLRYSVGIFMNVSPPYVISSIPIPDKVKSESTVKFTLPVPKYLIAALIALTGCPMM